MKNLLHNFFEKNKTVFLEHKGEIIILLLLCYILEYMHLSSFGFHKDMLMENATSVLIDSILLIILSGCITFFCKKATYIVAGTVAFLWVLPNVVYYRFFSQYLSFSCLQEIGNFNGTWWFGYIDKAFAIPDITIVIAFMTILALCTFSKIGGGRVLNIKWFVLTEVLLLSVSCFIIPLQRSLKWNMKYEVETLDKATFLYECNSSPLIYKYGIFRSQIYFNATHFHTGIDLTQNEIQDISKYIKSKSRYCSINDSLKGKNIVFILVESFLSVALNESVDGQKVMPNLSALVSEKDTYCNTNIHQNICAGESADGQLIYMTGLLPIRNVITVTECLRSELIGLPMLLRDSLGYTTCMTLPTNPNFYHQTEINPKYGIDRIESILNKGMFTNDEQLFKSASSVDKELKQPFFHILLSISMHAPYDEVSQSISNWDVKFPKQHSIQYQNYLKLCHYTDKQIGLYLEHLKRDGLWSNTIVVIAADHEAHDWLLKTSKKNINDSKLPLIIANTGIKPELLHSGDANQVDVFPTLLDIMGIKANWKGLGNSLLNNGYTWQKNLDKEYELSEKIIRGNYFQIINR